MNPYKFAKFLCLLTVLSGMALGQVQERGFAPVEFQKEVDDRGKKILIESKFSGEIHQQLRIFLNKELLLSVRRPLDERFQGEALYAPFLILFFGSGVHGQHVEIIDLDKGKKVFQVDSAWPVEVEKSGKKMKLIWYEHHGGDANTPPPALHKTFYGF